MAKKSKGVNTDMTGWVGWAYFAGIMMAVLGFFQVIEGLTALFKDSYYVVLPNAILNINFTQWGWTHLALGLLVLVAGFALLAGQVWGRVVGVLLAMLVAIANMLFIPAYPVWSILVITVAVLVIYALVVHGSELEE
jgi:hypothetical protein